VQAELVAPVGKAATAAEPRDAAPLTRRASLNAAAGLLDYVARIGVQFIITPILLGGLGRTLFGVWEVLTRLVTYVSATDGRPNEALRLVVAQQQAETDVQVRQRQVGAALAVWLLLLPLVMLAGVLIVWLAPSLTGVSAGQAGEVRLAGLLLFAAFVLTSLGAIAESVLRGSNLGYRRMGLQAMLHIVAGLLAALAVGMGLGLAGLAAAQVLVAVLTGVCFWLIVKRFVGWFGAARPTRAEIRGLLGMSVWIAAGDVIAKLLIASDVIVLGAVAGPAVVTTWVLTGYAARVATGVHVFAAGSAMPGLGDVLGRGEQRRAATARYELLLLTWLFATVTGALILLWNRSFLTLWVGPANYAGVLVDGLIVLIFAQTLFIRTDAWIIDAALKPARRVKVGAPAAVITIVASILLTRSFGLAGLALGILLGRLVQSALYPVFVSILLKSRGTRFTDPGQTVRLAAASLLICTGAAAAGQTLSPPTWWLWAAGVLATVPLTVGLALLLGPDAENRRRILQRARRLWPGGTTP
jgi:O-antigen/teichoic acid export membrane protein